MQTPQVETLVFSGHSFDLQWGLYQNSLLTVYIGRYKFSILSVAEVGCYRFNFNPFSNTPLPLRGVE